jgi:fatty acid desaturase
MLSSPNYAGRSWFWRYEGPTWLLAIGLYGAWFALVWFHAYLPWWILLPAGAYLAGLHFSLQHEAIHGWRSAPNWLRTLMVWPPIGLWLPFGIYRRSHTRHHRNADLTYPGRDTESLYHGKQAWQAHNPIWRGLLMANQTLVGRLTIGPILRLKKLVQADLGKFLKGDFSDAGIWLLHTAGVAVILYFVVEVAGMPLWEYLAYFFLAGMSLSWLRPFLEHRWAETPYGRVAAIESNWFFGLLFLWNNLHIVHHRFPTMAWYDIPGYFRANREALLDLNGGYYYRGYWQLARQFLFKPVFSPVHPDA